MTSHSQDASKEPSDSSHAAKKPPMNDSTGDNSPDSARSESPMESREAELIAECAELKDRLLRMAADHENVRKRVEREKVDLAKFATESLLRDLVPVLDSFEQAAPTGHETSTSKEISEKSETSFREGFQMVKKQLLTVLKKHGLEAVESVDKPFDPNFHQAIQRIEDPNAESETVFQEFAKGFTLNGRLLRAAMVSVKVPSAQ